MDKQEIENESLTGGTPEEGAYATTHEEVRQGYPVFGRIAGHSEDLEEVEIQIPYTHRLKWKSICYEKNIKAGIYTLFTGPEGDIKLTFRIKSSQSGSKAMENKEDPAPAGPANPKDHYEQRCLRLEGELHDADRKNRHLLDEIVQLKRALSEDRTETLLTHQQEIAEIKETHRNEVDRLKEAHQRDVKEFERQIAGLEKQAYKMELEQKLGSDDGWAGKIFDALEKHVPELLPLIMQSGRQPAGPSLSGLQSSPGQPHPQSPGRAMSEEEAEQFVDDLRQQMDNTGQTEEYSHGKPSDPIKTGEGSPTPLAGFPSRPEAEDNPEALNDSLAGRKNGQPAENMEV